MKSIKWVICSMVAALLVGVTTATAWSSMFAQEMMGLESGILHPFISFTGEYTDNLFSTQDNEKDDFFTKITPGVWVALPGTDVEVVSLSSATGAPGGFVQTRFMSGDMGRYQTYFRYAPTFENYADYDQRDMVMHQLDAYGAINLKSGLAFEIFDQYKDNRDSVTEQTDSAEFNSNVIGLNTSYLFTDKLRGRVDLRYFDINYDTTKNEKDREDVSISGFMFFAIKPKTSLFAEIQHVDIDYESLDEDGFNKDGTELKFFGGVRYDVTDRMDAMFKLGVMQKERDAGVDETSSMAFEGNLGYEVTDRIQLSASTVRTNRESTTGLYSTETRFSVAGSYEVSNRINSSLTVMVLDDDYDNTDREDTAVSISPELAYAINRWLNARLAYTYSDKDASGSDAGPSDYTRNTIAFTVSGAF